MRRLAILAATAVAAVSVSAHQAKAQSQVTCESINGRRNICAIDTSRGVQLTKTYSLNSCEQGQTWGVTRGAVWVSNGCRATFTSTNVAAGSGRYGTNDRYNNNNGWNNGNWNNSNANVRANAENLCRQAVRQRIGNRRVSTSVQNNSRNNVRVLWQSANGHSGSCRVERNGTVNLSIAR